MWLFRKKEREKSNSTIQKEIEVEDFSVEFYICSLGKMTKTFQTLVGYAPELSFRNDGVWIKTADTMFNVFMRDWHDAGFANMDDLIVKWDDFSKACITKNKRIAKIKIAYNDKE